MAKQWNIGRFTEPAEFLRPARRVSASGERETTWQRITVRYGEVEDPLLSATRGSDALPEEETLLLKTWHVEEATTECRVRLDGLLYDIGKVARQRGSITFYYIRRIDLCNE